MRLYATFGMPYRFVAKLSAEFIKMKYSSIRNRYTDIRLSVYGKASNEKMSKSGDSFNLKMSSKFFSIQIKDIDT